MFAQDFTGNLYQVFHATSCLQCRCRCDNTQYDEHYFQRRIRWLQVENKQKNQQSDHAHHAKADTRHSGADENADKQNNQLDKDHLSKVYSLVKSLALTILL